MFTIVANIYRSKKPMMVALRYTLVGAIIFLAIARLRTTLILLTLPENYTQRDILQIYLMVKGLTSGINPYLPLNELAVKFIGAFPFFPHPAPYPPFNAILFIPLSWLNFKSAIIVWYMIEILCLVALACVFSILWNSRFKWHQAVLAFFILLAWYPVMVDLEVGQLSILLTFLLATILLALQRNNKLLAGVLLGLSVAIKLITWPIIIFMILKKDWRIVITSSITAVFLNLVALLVMGSGTFLDYYFHVSAQVFNVYHKFWANFSLFTTGYRLFDGTDSAIFVNNFNAPPFFYFPDLAPLFSIGIVVSFLVICMVWAIRDSRIEISFAILVSLSVLISPIVWDHYFVLILLCLFIALCSLIKKSFPAFLTLSYILIVLLLFLFNDRIGTSIIYLNGGKDLLQEHGYQISFASSLLAWLPMVELIALTVIIWRSGLNRNKIQKISDVQPITTQVPDHDKPIQ